MVGHPPTLASLIHRTRARVLIAALYARLFYTRCVSSVLSLSPPLSPRIKRGWQSAAIISSERTAAPSADVGMRVGRQRKRLLRCLGLAGGSGEARAGSLYSCESSSWHDIPGMPALDETRGELPAVAIDVCLCFCADSSISVSPLKRSCGSGSRCARVVRAACCVGLV